MIKELREDYRNCFNNSALSSTAKRFSPTTLRFNVPSPAGTGKQESVLRSAATPDHRGFGGASMEGCVNDLYAIGFSRFPI